MPKKDGLKSIFLFLLYFIVYFCLSIFLLRHIFELSLSLVVENPLATKLTLGLVALILTVIQAIMSFILLRFAIRLKVEISEGRKEFDR
jgi:hypothetical protein